MNWLLQIARRRQIRDDLDEEIREHLRDKSEELMRDGLPQAEAERQARIALGNPVIVKERSGEVWLWPLAATFIADVRYASRQLCRNWGFTVATTLTLMLGIGANLAIFNVLDALLLESLPVKRTNSRSLPTPAEILADRLTATGSEPQNGNKPDLPLIIISSTGGGLHASAWTARILRQIYLSFDEQTASKISANELTRHILMISTVSGGSVGLEYYLEAIKANSNDPDLTGAAIEAQCSSLESVGWGLVYYDFTKALVPMMPYFMWPSSGEEDLDNSPMLKDRTWSLRKALERNTHDPYCYKAAQIDNSQLLSPGELTHKVRVYPWFDTVSRRSESDSRLTIGGLDPAGGFPAFTMNTTTVERGDRFLLANYRLPDYHLGTLEEMPAESFISSFDPASGPDLPLASAAQLSATFPYVSSAARVPTRYAPYSEHFVDGGYYDNDGTSSAIEFIRYALDRPDQETKDADAANIAALCQVMNALKGGPVKILLLEIRNSPDPGGTSRESRHLTTPNKLDTGISGKGPGMLQQLEFPLDAFWSAGHESVTGRNRNGLDLLIQSEQCKLQLHQIVLDYKNQDVSTNSPGWFDIRPARDPLSWSLTPRERQQIASNSAPDGPLRERYKEVNQWLFHFDSSYQKSTSITVPCPQSDQ